MIESADFDILSEAGVLAKTQQMQGLRESKDQVFPIERSIESQKIRANGDRSCMGAEDQAATRKHRCA